MRPFFPFNWRFTVCAVLVSVSAAGCGDSACEGFERSVTDEAPSITKMRLVSQLSGDPWTSIFGVGFTDADGDLGVGKAHAEFFLNSKSAATVQLIELFQGGGLEPAAKGGELAIPLRFSETVENGAAATLGVQLVDDDGNRSNCYSLDLNFTVKPVQNP